VTGDGCEGCGSRYEAAEQLRALLDALDRGDLTASPRLRLLLTGAVEALDAQPWHEPDRGHEG